MSLSGPLTQLPSKRLHMSADFNIATLYDSSCYLKVRERLQAIVQMQQVIGYFKVLRITYPCMDSKGCRTANSSFDEVEMLNSSKQISAREAKAGWLSWEALRS